MGEFKGNYKKLLREIVRKDFPSLNKKWILVGRFGFFKLKYLGICWPFFFGAIIGIHPKTKGLTKGDLEYIFAHELSHFEILNRMNIFNLICFAFEWVFTKNKKVWFERECDLLAIRRGYGEQYYNLLLKAEKRRTKEEFNHRSKKGYLTSKEVLNELKKIKK